LEDISTVFHRAGRREDNNLFLCGFGNSPTDGVAYLAAGVHPDFIFIIDIYSDIRIWGCGGSNSSGLNAGEGVYEGLVPGVNKGGEEEEGPVFLSYGDTRLWIFLRSRLGLGGKPKDEEEEKGGDGDGSSTGTGNTSTTTYVSEVTTSITTPTSSSKVQERVEATAAPAT